MSMNPDAAKGDLVRKSILKEGENFESLLKKHRTLAGVIKAIFEPHYPRIPRIACGPTYEANRKRYERIFRPWPKWVFRVAAELWHVQFPTISKEIFFDTFRVANVILFRCSLNAESVSRIFGKMDGKRRLNFEVVQLVMASFVGHSVEHFKATRRDLETRRQSGELSQKDYEECMTVYSVDMMEDLMRSAFEVWSKDKDTKPSDMARAVEEARRKTYDKHGRPKETTLTPIYRKMWENWIVVENMSGPKELTGFLYPDSKGDAKAAQKQFTRVATMCSRLGVKFRGGVKEF